MPARLRTAAAIAAACATMFLSLPQSAAVARPWFTDHGGAIKHATHVYLVYWGSEWTERITPTAGQVTNAVRATVASPYLSGLSQYRGIGPATWEDSTTIVTSYPPSRFTDDQVGEFLDAQFDARTVPGPDDSKQNLYIVLLSGGVSSGENEFGGEHSYYERAGHRVHFAWISRTSKLNTTSRLISHELVESVTDPEGSAVLGVPGTCDRPGWCEISDICAAHGFVNGVAVQSYWSNADRACIIPGAQPARRRPPTDRHLGGPTALAQKAAGPTQAIAWAG